MPLGLRQIETFRAVMITGSITAAARLLSISQPSISRQIAHTEDVLKFKLFERAKGRLFPTQEAKRLMQYVDLVYRGVQRVDEMAEEIRGRSVGTVRVVSSPSLGHTVLPKVIAAFHAKFPDVRIKFHVLTLSEIVEEIISGQADIGVVTMPTQHPNMVVETLAGGELICICPEGHPLAKMKAVSPQDLQGHTLIGYNTGSNYGLLVDQFFAAADVTTKPDIEVGFAPTACSLVQAGCGVAIVDEFVLFGQEWPGIVKVPVVPSTDFTLRLVKSALEPLSVVAQSFVDVLGKQLTLGR